jgi:hypothetical protein
VCEVGSDGEARENTRTMGQSSKSFLLSTVVVETTLALLLTPTTLMTLCGVDGGGGILEEEEELVTAAEADFVTAACENEKTAEEVDETGEGPPLPAPEGEDTLGAMPELSAPAVAMGRTGFDEAVAAMGAAELRLPVPTPAAVLLALLLLVAAA